tara:strand:- start:146 stop:685 length:540 start_codon:yes stop_codon:yes gene_type:complete
MRSEQLFLFEEHDISKTLVKDIDFIDLSKLPDDPMRRKYGDSGVQYKDLPSDTYIMYKTGGTNRYKPEKGKIFPYIQNKNTGKILLISATKTDLYPKVNLGYKPAFIARMHRLVGLAFYPLPDNFNITKGNFWVVNHIDHDITNYEVSNCEWVTQKQNCNGGTKKDSMEEQRKIHNFFS